MRISREGHCIYTLLYASYRVALLTGFVGLLLFSIFVAFCGEPGFTRS